MFIVMGATGHVGSAVVENLLQAGESVTALIRDQGKAAALQAKGAEVAIVDVGDAQALRAVLRTGQRAFLLNPPAPISGNTDTEERRTASAIVEALNGSGLDGVVAQSTYGAQPGRGKGDLSVLFEFEEALRAQPIPVMIQRGAYYLSNWDPMVDAARQGILPTMFPADFELPMVAPSDLGREAASLLRGDFEHGRTIHTEGPERYTPQGVANAFAAALNRPVDVAVTPKEEWVSAFRKLGFSEEAARSFAGMTAATLDARSTTPSDLRRGSTTLEAYVGNLIA
ncbi:NAD(P)H-binding protein [Aureimonas altamirensis]|uniref:NmrA family NAD(P)-binding protein n=1 Tax=Aureimonas altamirensis TaxID=370622 RepID=UPI001E48AE02|nr:NAD(P)H-binding protein [Aureimonas altamirensis]UHD44017.1 NAD(P)H-binding protein [Aureimonas altamirensis]